MKKAKSTQKKYWEMTAAELAAATREFDGPIDFEQTKPLSPEQRARFERSRKAGGRRTQHVFAFDLDPKLMAVFTTYAEQRKVPVSKLIERSVRGLMAFEPI